MLTKAVVCLEVTITGVAVIRHSEELERDGTSEHAITAGTGGGRTKGGVDSLSSLQGAHDI